MKNLEDFSTTPNAGAPDVNDKLFAAAYTGETLLLRKPEGTVSSLPPVELNLDQIIPNPYKPGEFGSYIKDVAKQHVGEQMWNHPTNYMSNGEFGCAASVSNVLKLAGIDFPGSASVQGLRAELFKLDPAKYKVEVVPWEQRKPGDILLLGSTPGSYQSGGGAHTGIIGENGTFYDNSETKPHNFRQRTYDPTSAESRARWPQQEVIRITPR